jgi:pyruvate kinase
MPATWLARLRTGERVKFTDARDAKRAFAVVEVTDRGCWAEATKTAYVIPGTVLRCERRPRGGGDREAPVGHLPPGENAISLGPGDLLLLTRDRKPGRPATRDSAGQVLTPAAIGCTIPDVFDDVRSGEVIRFDDGKIGGVVEKVEADRVLVRITQARLRGDKLRGDKGISVCPEGFPRESGIFLVGTRILEFRYSL